MPDEQGTITRAVNALAGGEAPTSVDPCIERIYEELRQIAAARLRRDPGAVLQPTELVHDAILKLFRHGQSVWDSRAHFFGSAARAMQQLLIDDARRRPRRPTPLDGVPEIARAERASDPVALARAIDELHAHDAGLAELVRLRVFAGLSAADTSQILKVSERTLSRQWSFACAWLLRNLDEGRGRV